MHCDRYWFLRWTTYGTWLPGAQRGFVSDIKRDDGTTVRHNVPGTDFDSNMPALEAYAASLQESASVRLSETHAVLLLNQLLETAEVRQWALFSVAIMANHCHLVVGVPGEPDPKKLLGDFKSYGSRKLNRDGHTVPHDKRWTKSGSKRKLPDEQAILNDPVHCGSEIPARRLGERRPGTQSFTRSNGLTVVNPSASPQRELCGLIYRVTAMTIDSEVLCMAGMKDTPTADAVGSPGQAEAVWRWSTDVRK